MNKHQSRADTIVQLFHRNRLWLNAVWAAGLGSPSGAFIAIVAALNLILDFDFVQTGVPGRAATYMEWYRAFGIMATLVWRRNDRSSNWRPNRTVL